MSFSRSVNFEQFSSLGWNLRWDLDSVTDTGWTKALLGSEDILFKEVKRPLNSINPPMSARFKLLLLLPHASYPHACNGTAWERQHALGRTPAVTCTSVDHPTYPVTCREWLKSAALRGSCMTFCSPGLSPWGSLLKSIHPETGECVDTAD